MSFKVKFMSLCKSWPSKSHLHARVSQNILAPARACEALNLASKMYFGFSIKVVLVKMILGFYTFPNPKHARSDEEMLCKCFDKCSKALAINTG